MKCIFVSHRVCFRAFESISNMILIDGLLLGICEDNKSIRRLALDQSDFNIADSASILIEGLVIIIILTVPSPDRARLLKISDKMLYP